MVRIFGPKFIPTLFLFFFQNKYCKINLNQTQVVLMQANGSNSWDLPCFSKHELRRTNSCSPVIGFWYIAGYSPELLSEYMFLLLTVSPPLSLILGEKKITTRVMCLDEEHNKLTPAGGQTHVL